ncbi:MAG: hypothetical protein EZS28_049162 [Streblomastix strix]|uniref:Uncharacterized protein n=1 Tax=Streblomastix strix TaxID=222440 RepID=A0A5J4TCC5_9EUKA|nr:MAG: hypothetical protein EZS28_049162 [Streblomastix strix]
MRTLEKALVVQHKSSEKITLLAHMDEGTYFASGINATQKYLTLYGNYYIEIKRDQTSKQPLFFGKYAHISLHRLRFISDDYLVARIDKDSQLVFNDNTIASTAVVGNCFEIEGGQFLITNLKLDFKINSERRISNFVQFGKHGGYLEVHKTSLEGITIG